MPVVSIPAPMPNITIIYIYIYKKYYYNVGCCLNSLIHTASSSGVGFFN